MSDFAEAEELFHRALEVPLPDRVAFLEREAPRPQLALLAGEFLAGHVEGEDDFLQPPNPEDMGGHQVGEFVLMRLLGAGGMGAVYAARQERPQRVVALKLVRTLPGVPQDRHRLELEAQAMGRLCHPHVAQIYQVGRLDDAGGNFTWFAMELVQEARSLLTFAEEEQLDQTARIALLLDVADAVQHGHNRGVIHRDIKPDNLLVGADGQVKVIDFGIAHATGAGVTVRGTPDEWLGTLAYMSPEQGLSDPVDVDARTDVYSLGVVLFELLTGRRPHAFDGRPITEALRILQHDPPPRPASLMPGIGPDLETVVLTALAKEPDERYATAEAFAADLRRVLAHLPIQARPPGLAHQARLFARRHAAATAVGIVVGLALVATTIVSTLSARTALEAQELERSARLHAEAVAQTFQDLFTAARPNRHPDREVTARELLVDAAATAERRLADQPAALADFLGTIGFSHALLGELATAEVHLERAAELADQVRDYDPLKRAQLESQRGFVAVSLGRVEDGIRLCERAVESLGRGTGEGTSDHIAALYRLAQAYLLADRHTESATLLQRALALAEGTDDDHQGQLLSALGDIAYQEGDFPGSAQYHRRALALYESVLHPDHPLLIPSRVGLANALFNQGQHDEAEALWLVVRDVYERRIPDHPDRATVLTNLGHIALRRREWETAEERYREALILRETAFGTNDHRVAVIRGNLSTLFTTMGALERAEQEGLLAIEVQRAFLAANQLAPDLTLANLLDGVGVLRFRGKRWVEAEEILSEALGIRRGLLPVARVRMGTTLTLLGVIRLEQGDAEGAEPLLQEAYGLRNELMADNWLTDNSASVLGGCLATLGRIEEAEPLLLRGVHGLLGSLGPEDFRTRDAIDRALKAFEAVGMSTRVTEIREAVSDRP